MIEKIFNIINGKRRNFSVFEKIGINRKELKRLRSLPRFTRDRTLIFERELNFVDCPTFLSSLKEIFIDEIYKFHSGKAIINIIDCGANIGLATLYFKKLFANAHIVAFEPDPNIFRVLEQNISSFGYQNVLLKNEAVSNSNSVISFHLEGGHSGMIVDHENAENVIQIKSKRLNDVLEQYQRITFLKMDIEGHEVNVITDIANSLHKVDYLFLEYHSFINSDQKLQQILAIITEAGFRYYIKEAFNKRFPFIEKEIFLKMDLLLNIFCYRD